MNCKPGDLAIIVKAINPSWEEVIGSLVTIIGPAPFRAQGYWEIQFVGRPIVGDPRNTWAYPDTCLRPIRGELGEDEIISERETTV